MTNEEAIKKAIEDFEWAIHADNRSDISLRDMRLAVSALREQPVVHGRWENYPSNLYIRCSACKVELYKQRFKVRANYCPNCGAKMDGE